MFGLFAGIATLPLSEPDEGRYGDIAATMARTGDYLTPRLNGIRYFEKPPLYFWAAAAAIEVLGPTPLAIRIPSSLASFATCLLVWHWGSRLGRPAGVRGLGIVAAAILGSTPLFAALAHVAIVDPTVTLCTTAALYCAFRGIGAEGTPGARRWAAGFWVAGALAVLAKGPIGLLLPASGVGSYVLLRWDRRAVRAILSPAGWLAFLAVAAPWYALMERENPGYLRDFLGGQYVERFLGGPEFGRAQPFWYYVPVFLGTFLPWTLFLPAAARRVRESLRRRREGEAAPLLFLACATTAPFVLLSVSGSKLGYYLLPLAPPFAILAGLLALAPPEPAERGRAPARALGAFAGLLLLGAVGSGAAVLLPSEPLRAVAWKLLAHSAACSPGEDPFANLGLLMAVGSCALGVLAVLVAALARAARRAPDTALVRAGIFLHLGLAALVTLVPRAECVYSAEPLANAVAAAELPGEPVVLYGEFVRALPFRLGHPVVLWNATFAEFGHRVSGEEALELSLQGDRKRLADFLSRHRSVLIVDARTATQHPLATVSPVPLEKVSEVGPFTIWRSRKG